MINQYVEVADPVVYDFTLEIFEAWEEDASLYKLKVTVEWIDGYCNQPRLVGDHFFVDEGRISVPAGKTICMWALQAMMPIFPLLQRVKPEEADWTRKGCQFVCPDPKGRVHYRIETMDAP